MKRLLLATAITTTEGYSHAPRDAVRAAFDAVRLGAPGTDQATELKR